MNILVLGGGDSPEYDVSLRSAKNVAAAARQAGFDVFEADPKYGLGFIDDITRDTIIFPILHGAGGEDGSLQLEFEKRNLPYLGSNSYSSANCFDKAVARRALQASAILMPVGDSVTAETYQTHPFRQKPHVLKVARGGSSIGTLWAPQPDQVPPEKIDQLFQLDEAAVIEELIVGTEITVPVLDKTALPVIEIVPPAGEKFDYPNKYNGRTKELCPPKTVDAETQHKAQRLAERVHEIMQCRHLSRVDIMIGRDGRLYVLEINIMPGLTEQSLYPKGAAAAGLTMPELVKKFAYFVERDYQT
jgi:D-alanine-D-alanine ligase